MVATPSERRIRVLLADDHDVARRAVAGMLRPLPGVVLVGEAETQSDLACQLLSTAADVLVIDDGLVDSSGWPLSHTRLPVIVMGLDGDAGYARRAHLLGAKAWVPKERADLLLPDALASATGRSRLPGAGSAAA